MSESSDRESHDPLPLDGRHGGEKGEPSVDSEVAAYREMQRNYIELEAIANRVLALPHTLEVGSSNQASPSGGSGHSGWCPFGEAEHTYRSEVGPASADYCVPPYVGLRLPTAIDVVRYPSNGSVMIFTDMYRHGFRLPFHPWVQMMLAKLGYAPGQYNPNFWILLHGVYIAWWLTGLEEPTFEQFMFGEVGPISKEQEDEVERVRSQLSETELAGIIKGSTKVVVDIDDAEMQKQLRESRANKAEKGTGKRPRDDDEGRVADVLGKGGEGGLRQATSAEEGRELSHAPTGGAPSERLPECVKSDPEALASTLASSYIDRAQKTILTSAYMYVSMAKADKEIQRLKRRDAMAKSKMAEVQEAIREKNTSLWRAETVKGEEVAAARVEAIESFRTSEELKSYIMDRLVDEQLRWEDRLVRFNPSVEINFDTKGEPPAPSPTRCYCSDARGRAGH
ncbi:hypothetical protein Prudu_1446S002100 [Prunus dulcis]|uniref:Uncharacterized protein n=1 Tax=Prunus dulcis TaxID=3755 RepID=A0A5H2XUD5_PRUDU|nr:hypothetical protein Prudu_1446S002100 [Prunus dulcis]